MIEINNIQFMSVVICADYDDDLIELLTNIFTSGCTAKGYSIESVDITGLPEVFIGGFITQNT